MNGKSSNFAEIHLQLPGELKRLIEKAATVSGQTVNEFVISVVINEARRVLQNSQITRLSDRDRERFIAALEETNSRPNAALRRAATRYKNRHD
ncbi:MAG TPA: DUF1778 domain-containing protein [Thermoguttaceae bacterium]|nr:DUF1778 domain-containing protein [Thermoguttaceae bacterium]